MRPSLAVGITTLALASVLSSCATKRRAPATSTAESSHPTVAITQAPDGVDVPGLVWVKVTAPGLGVMLAAIARPQGSGPFPALIILHGTHGFAQQYVHLAQDIARYGVFAVAACWFSGGSGEGLRFVASIDCHEAPALTIASSPTATQTVDALVQAVRTLSDVDTNRVALFGHSRGGGAALQYVLKGGAVWMIALNSTGYPRDVSDQASLVNVPVLIMHGIADSPADGGSAFTDVHMAQKFESALRTAGKTVEAVYYEGGHNGIFTSASQYDDEVQRIVRFLRRNLVN